MRSSPAPAAPSLQRRMKSSAKSNAGSGRRASRRFERAAPSSSLADGVSMSVAGSVFTRLGVYLVTKSRCFKNNTVT